MPELPEVESIRIGLATFIVGHALTDVVVTNAKSFRGEKEKVKGATIERVRRFAKVLVIDLDNAFSLLIHLKMTGQLIYTGPNLKAQVLSGKSREPGGKHTRVLFQLDREGTLFFNDTRKFGWVQAVKTSEVSSFDFIRRLGPEPFGSLTLSLFQKILTGSRSPIKLLLMNQEKIGGIGNIYANDALWLARIHPQRPASSLTAAEQKILYKAVLNVLRNGIVAGGASETSYVHPDGSEGSYQEQFLVYGKKDEPCKRCGSVILKISLGGRGTYVCPDCQKI